MIDDLVTDRLARQEILQGDAIPDLYLIIDETALHRQVGGPAVHADQLDRLIELARRPGIAIQVIPATTGAHAGLIPSFTILGFLDSPDIAYSEDAVAGHLAETREAVAEYKRKYDFLRLAALPVTTSLELIEKLRKEAR